MLTKFDVTTSKGDVLTLQLNDISSGFVVQPIDGLGPVKATLSSSAFAGLDGEQFQSSQLGTRNIVITLGLDPDPLVTSVRSLRKQLYSYFMPKSEVTLGFYEDDGFQVTTVGIVESCEPAIFDQEPAVVISIICYDPILYAPTPEVLSGSSTASTAVTIVNYDGDFSAGFVFTLNVNRTLSELTIYHTTPSNDLQTLDFSAPLVAGDVLTISTVTGNKGATLLHSGSSSSVLYGIPPQSDWPQMMPGNNQIRIYAVGAAIPYTLSYTTKYGGL